VALLDDGALVVFRPGEAAALRTLVPKGLTAKLVGIDRRPADGKLYGLAGGTDVYTLDPTSGEATLVSTLTVPFDGDVRSGVDFTPQLDRLRLVSIDGRNVRVNVAIGATAVDKPLYTIDLATGRATPAGAIPGAARPVVSLAVLGGDAR